jgi:hypothetical protein
MSTKKELEVIVETSQLSPEENNQLRTSFMPFFDQANDWIKKANKIVVTDTIQKDQMALARNARLKLKEIRVNVEKNRKELKESIVRKGKAIDGMANILKFLIEPVEEYLQEQEDFAEVQEAKRKDALESERREILAPFGKDISFYNLRDMTQEAFDGLVEIIKNSIKVEEEAQKKADKERAAQEKKDKEEREAQQKENDRLRKEAQKRDEELRIEREAREQREREEKAEKEKQEAQKRDQEKLEKRKAFMKFREEHGWTEETKGDFRVEEGEEGFILFKKVGIFKK